MKHKILFPESLYRSSIIVLSACSILSSAAVHAQIPAESLPGLNYFTAQAFSESVSLYRAKEFVMKNVLENNSTGVEFFIEPLHAATSGELTTLRFECAEQNKSGLILAFYGKFLQESGVEFQGYAFKYYPEESATVFLNRIHDTSEEHKEFLRDDYNNNNISLQLDDLLILITHSEGSYMYRLFWDRFDSEWNGNALKKTQKRFLAE